MPRRRVEFEVTMFPFMSVLCAIIGVMMLLLLLILGSRVVGEEDPAGGGVGRRAPGDESRQRVGPTERHDAAELARSPAVRRRTGTRLGAPEPVILVPDSKRKVDKTPILVEVRADGFVVHPQKTAYPLQQLGQVDSPLIRFLGDVAKNRDRQYLLLLLRPNGVAAYRRLRAYLQKQHGQSAPLESPAGRAASLDVGKEPFSPDWLLLDDQTNPAQ